VSCDRDSQDVYSTFEIEEDECGKVKIKVYISEYTSYAGDAVIREIVAHELYEAYRSLGLEPDIDLERLINQEIAKAAGWEELLDSEEKDDLGLEGKGRKDTHTRARAFARLMGEPSKEGRGSLYTDFLRKSRRASLKIKEAAGKFDKPKADIMLITEAMDLLSYIQNSKLEPLDFLRDVLNRKDIILWNYATFSQPVNLTILRLLSRLLDEGRIDYIFLPLGDNQRLLDDYLRTGEVNEELFRALEIELMPQGLPEEYKDLQSWISLLSKVYEHNLISARADGVRLMSIDSLNSTAEALKASIEEALLQIPQGKKAIVFKYYAMLLGESNQIPENSYNLLHIDSDIGFTQEKVNKLSYALTHLLPLSAGDFVLETKDAPFKDEEIQPFSDQNWQRQVIEALRAIKGELTQEELDRVNGGLAIYKANSAKFNYFGLYDAVICSMYPDEGGREQETENMPEPEEKLLPVGARSFGERFRASSSITPVYPKDFSHPITARAMFAAAERIGYEHYIKKNKPDLSRHFILGDGIPASVPISPRLVIVHPYIFYSHRGVARKDLEQLIESAGPDQTLTILIDPETDADIENRDRFHFSQPKTPSLTLRASSHRKSNTDEGNASSPGKESYDNGGERAFSPGEREVRSKEVRGKKQAASSPVKKGHQGTKSPVTSEKGDASICLDAKGYAFIFRRLINSLGVMIGILWKDLSTSKSLSPVIMNDALASNAACRINSSLGSRQTSSGFILGLIYSARSLITRNNSLISLESIFNRGRYKTAASSLSNWGVITRRKRLFLNAEYIGVSFLLPFKMLTRTLLSITTFTSFIVKPLTSFFADARDFFVGKFGFSKAFSYPRDNSIKPVCPGFLFEFAYQPDFGFSRHSLYQPFYSRGIQFQSNFIISHNFHPLLDCVTTINGFLTKVNYKKNSPAKSLSLTLRVNSYPISNTEHRKPNTETDPPSDSEMSFLSLLSVFLASLVVVEMTVMKKGRLSPETKSRRDPAKGGKVTKSPVTSERSEVSSPGEKKIETPLLNYPAIMPASDESDREPSQRELEVIIEALGGKVSLGKQGIDIDNRLVISPSLAAPAQVRAGTLYINPNMLRGPPKHLRVVLEGHELFHLLKPQASEQEAYSCTLSFLVREGLLSEHIRFLQTNQLGIVPDESWLKKLISAEEEIIEIVVINSIFLIETARGITNESDKAQALLNIASCLAKINPEQLETLIREAIETARGITDEYWKAQALLNIASCLAKIGAEKENLTLIREAIETARGITNEYRKARALSDIASCLAKINPEQLETLIRKAIKTARGITNEYRKAQALLNIASCLAKIGRAVERVFRNSEKIESLLKQALADENKDMLKAIGFVANRTLLDRVFEDKGISSWAKAFLIRGENLLSGPKQGSFKRLKGWYEKELKRKSLRGQEALLDTLVFLVTEHSDYGESFNYLKGKTETIIKRRKPSQGKKKTVFSQSEELLFDALVETGQPHALIPLAVRGDIVLAVREKYLIKLSRKGIMDWDLEEVLLEAINNNKKNEFFEFISRIYRDLEILPPSVMVDYLLREETTIEELQTLRPEVADKTLPQLLDLFESEGKEDKRLLVYFIFNQPRLSYGWPLKFELLKRVIEQALAARQAKDNKPLEKLQQALTKRAGSQRADEIISALGEGRASPRK